MGSRPTKTTRVIIVGGVLILALSVLTLPLIPNFVNKVRGTVKESDGHKSCVGYPIKTTKIPEMTTSPEPYTEEVAFLSISPDGIVTEAFVYNFPGSRFFAAYTNWISPNKNPSWESISVSLMPDQGPRPDHEQYVFKAGDLSYVWIKGSDYDAPYDTPPLEIYNLTKEDLSLHRAHAVRLLCGAKEKIADAAREATGAIK